MAAARYLLSSEEQLVEECSQKATQERADPVHPQVAWTKSFYITQGSRQRKAVNFIFNSILKKALPLIGHALKGTVVSDDFSLIASYLG